MKKIEVDNIKYAAIFCSECCEEVEKLIEFEDEEETVWLCEDCLKKGLEMLK